MATCAICDQPILSQREAGAFGTEVVHKLCVRTIGAGNTILIRTKRKMMQLEASAMAERNILNGRLVDANHEIKDLKARLEKAERRLEQQREQTGEKSLTIIARDADIRSLHHELGALELRVQDLTRQRDAARDEASMYRTLGMQPVQKPTPGSADKADDRDPAEVRFGLLELDKPK